MKKVLITIGLIATTLVLNSCQWTSSVTLTITHYSLTNESVRLVQGLPSLQPISMSVGYEVTDENNEVSNVTLADGPLVDGILKLVRKVNEPTEVIISVNNGTDGDNAEATAVLRPDTEVEFVVIHKITASANYYLVEIRGTTQLSKQIPVK